MIIFAKDASVSTKEVEAFRYTNNEFRALVKFLFIVYFFARKLSTFWGLSEMVSIHSMCKHFEVFIGTRLS